MLPKPTETMLRKVCLLHGIGGVGKTQLAAQFARLYRMSFSAVFLIDGSTKDKLRRSIFSIASKLPQYQISERARSVPRTDEDFDAVVKDVLKWFAKPSNDKWLLIFDNVDREFSAQFKDPEGFEFEEYFPDAEQGSIIITSQLEDVQLIGKKRLKLEPFDDRQGKDLLKSIVGRDLEGMLNGRRIVNKGPSNLRAGSSKLVNLLQGHPLAINQAGSYMRETSKNALTYMQLYEDTWEELMEQQHENPVERGILTTWTLSFDNLKEKSNDAANFLLLWALLDNQDIWYELFTAALDHKITKQLPGWFSRCVDGEFQFGKRVKLLTRYSLVSANLESSSFSMHAILQRWCLHNLGENIAMAWLAIVVTASAVPAETGIDYTIQQRRLLPHCTRSYRLLQHIPETIDDESSLPELSFKELSLALNTACHLLAKVLIDQGKILEAEAMYERELRGKIKFLGPEDKSTLDTVNNLGNLSLHQGKLQKAEEMYVRALEGKKKACGLEDVSTMDTRNNLGALYKAQGKWPKAEKMYQQALAGYEKALGPGHISTMDTLHNLGVLYTIQNKFRDAEHMYVKAYAGKRKFLGPDHTSTLETVNDLGSLYKKQGKMTEAEEMYNTALAGKVKSWGAEHTFTLATVNNLGMLFAEQGKMSEAENRYVQALNGFKKALGPEHITTLETTSNLGYLYFKQSKLPEAEEMFVEALSGNEKALGPEHPSTLATVYNLGILYSIQGKVPEAEEKYQWALTGFEKTLGAEHPSTLAAAGILGTVYRTQGKMAEAKARYLQALTGYENTLGPEDILTIRIVENLGFTYHGQGDLPEAVAMFKRALAGFEKASGPEHKTTLETAFYLGILYYNQGNLPEAEAMYKRAFAGYERMEGTEHRRRTFDIRYMLAGLLEEMSKIEIATEHFKEIVQGYTELLGPADPVTVKALDSLKSCEARNKKSGDNVTGDADGNGGNGGDIGGGCDVTGDVDGNNGGSGRGVGYRQ